MDGSQCVVPPPRSVRIEVSESERIGRRTRDESLRQTTSSHTTLVSSLAHSRSPGLCLSSDFGLPHPEDVSPRKRGRGHTTPSHRHPETIGSGHTCPRVGWDRCTPTSDHRVSTCQSPTRKESPTTNNPPVSEVVRGRSREMSRKDRERP